MRIGDTVAKSNGYEVVALLQSERKGQGPNREAAGKFAPLQAGLVAQLEANPDATLQIEALPDLGAGAWLVRKHDYHGSCHQGSGLDAKKCL
jgi:hypothetical protein